MAGREASATHGSKVSASEAGEEARALATMTRKIAHDMNNLITGIFGHAELAAMSPDLPHDVLANLDGVIDAATRASHLATQLLLLGRRITSEPTDVDLGSSMDVACQVLRNQLPRSIELAVERPETKVTVFADPSELHQMIINFCENGRDAIGDKAGKITLSLRTHDLGEEALVAPRSEGWIVEPGLFGALTIHDSGAGIHISALPRLFEPFFSTKGAIGTGLGLTIIRRIVLALGGFVEVKTLLGHGSTFTVFIPSK